MVKCETKEMGSAHTQGSFRKAGHQRITSAQPTLASTLAKKENMNPKINLNFMNLNQINQFE